MAKSFQPSPLTLIMPTYAGIINVKTGRTSILNASFEFMQTFHTFFKKEIFAEFMVPLRPSQKVVLICSGVPGVPTKRSLMEFFARKGYWAFHIRYRGSWESKGV